MNIISVVIPTYNRREYLRGAIETTLGQTYDGIEVIVVDDGSETRYASKIVKEYSDQVQLLQHKKNKGLSAARNTGIRNAKGKYIAFLDDDDRWHKAKLARQIEAVGQDENVGVATCLVAAVTPDNELVYCESSAPSGNCSKELMTGNKIGTPSRVLVRRKAIRDVGDFDESLPTKQDWDFYLRLCQKWEVAAVKDHLCFRTVHDSMSSSPESAERDALAILTKHEETIRSKGLWDAATAEIADRVGRAYLESGDLKTARRHFRRSISLEPTTRRVMLFTISFTSRKMVEEITNIKRKVQLKSSGCDTLELTPNQIPGLES